MYFILIINNTFNILILNIVYSLLISFSYHYRYACRKLSSINFPTMLHHLTQ